MERGHVSGVGISVDLDKFEHGIDRRRGRPGSPAGRGGIESM